MKTIDTDLYGYYVKSVLDSSDINFALVCNIGTGYLSEISREKFDELFSRGLIHGVRSVGNEYSIKCYDNKEAILDKYVACLTLLHRVDGFSFNASGYLSSTYSEVCKAYWKLLFCNVRVGENHI